MIAETVRHHVAEPETPEAALIPAQASPVRPRLMFVAAGANPDAPEATSLLPGPTPVKPRSCFIRPASRLAGGVLLLLLLFSTRGRADPSDAPSEARGIWVHLTHFNADPVQGKAEVEAFVDRYAEANFNLVLPWVLSEYMAALTDPSYLDSQPTAKWDALGALVHSARQHHLQVHFWYSFTYYKSPRSPEFNPEHGGNPAWAARRVLPAKTPGQPPVVSAPMTDVCPMHPEARAWQIKLLEAMLERYPGISIHIEEPGFGYPGSCVCDLCQSLFRKIYGTDLVESIHTPQAEDFRCLGTTELIRELRTKLASRTPRPCLSVNGGPLWRSDRQLGRDWKRWADLGWLDYYAAQNYTDDPDRFTQLTRGVLQDLQPCPVFVGIGVKWSGGATPLPTVLQEIEQARKLGASGVVLFSATALTAEDLARLKAGPFRQPSLYPEARR